MKSKLLCFWCRKPTGAETDTPEGVPAGMDVVGTYEPCLECIKKFRSGVLLVEATEKPQKEGQFPLKSKTLEAFPTGRWMVIEDEMVDYVFLPDVAAGIKKDRKALVGEEAFNVLVDLATPEDKPEKLN